MQTFFICAEVLLKLKFTIRHLFRVELMIHSRCKNMHLNLMMHTMRQKHAVKTILNFYALQLWMCGIDQLCKHSLVHSYFWLGLYEWILSLVFNSGFFYNHGV